LNKTVAPPSVVASGNHNQPAPILTGASQATPGTVQVVGVLAAATNTTYTVEFFATPSGTAGQGKTFLGSVTVTTDSNGIAALGFSGALPPNAGSFFTATATNPTDDTSAFSTPTTFAPPTPQQQVVVQTRNFIRRHRRRRWFWRHLRLSQLGGRGD
jgi:hypothetical protein